MPAPTPPPVPFSVRATASFLRALGLYGQQEHPATGFQDLDGDSGMEAPGAMTGFDAWRDTTNTPIKDRKERYRIFDDMDYGMVSSVLDAYAEEATQPDYMRERSVWVESSSPEQVTEGDICLRNLQIEDTVYAITRETCKYGDHFRPLHYATGKGVLGWTAADPRAVERIDDYLGRLAGFKVEGRKFRKQTSDMSYPFDLIHFRLMQGKASGQYGMGILDSLFSPWRQLALAEDTVLMYSFRRAASRNMVLVDTNGLGEAASMQYLNSVRKKFRKHEFVDPASANYRKNFNPMTTVEDIFLPVRGAENGTRIEQLTGASDASSLADLDHFRRKFFGTARVPQAYFGFEGDINAKATLITQDVRFARTIKRIRRSTLQGIRRAIELHYTFRPNNPDQVLYDPSKPESFAVRMAPINALDEFERLELVRAKVDLMESMAQLGDLLRLPKPIWAEYVLTEYARLPKAVVAKLVAGVVDPNQAPTESNGYGSLSAGDRELITEHLRQSFGLQGSLMRLEEYYMDESTRPPAGVGPYDILNETDEGVIAGKKSMRELFEGSVEALDRAAKGQVNG